MVLNTTFNNIVVFKIIDGGNQSTWNKLLTCRKSLTTSDESGNAIILKYTYWYSTRVSPTQQSVSIQCICTYMVYLIYLCLKFYIFSELVIREVEVWIPYPYQQSLHFDTGTIFHLSGFHKAKDQDFHQFLLGSLYIFIIWDKSQEWL